MGLFAGRISDLYSKRPIIFFASIGWSVFTVLQGLSEDYLTVFISRVGLGLCHAFSGPASYSLIAELYKPEERAGANGIYALGIYVGGGLSSLSLLMANEFGWRLSSFVIAASGLVSSFLFWVFSKQNDVEITAAEAPKRLGYLVTLRIILSNKIPVLLLTASPIRFVGGLAIGTFLPLFFKGKFPDQGNTYSVINAFIVSVGGAISAYLGGFIVDNLRDRDVRAPALVPAIGSLLAIVPFLGVLYSSNFYVAMFCLFVEYLVAECWFGPAISVLQNNVPGPAIGTAVSIQIFASGLVGSVAPVLLGSLDDGTVDTLRFYLALFVTMSYSITGFIFLYLARTIRLRSTSEYQQLLS